MRGEDFDDAFGEPSAPILSDDELPAQLEPSAPILSDDELELSDNESLDRELSGYRPLYCELSDCESTDYSFSCRGFSSVQLRYILDNYKNAVYFFKELIVEKIISAELPDEEFKQTVEDFNNCISKPASFKDTDYGYIVKEELPEGTRVDFRADFHGDLKSCVDYLESLKIQGILDDNYVIQEEHRGSFKAIFMGDYLDRGGDSKKVLYLLMKFKITNPDNVELLCGNHETATPDFYPCEGVKEVVQTVGEDLLDECFQRMPRAYIYGVRADDGTVEYTHVSHAAFDPDIDIEPLLASKEKRAIMSLSKNKPYELSDRVKALIPAGVSRAKDEDCGCMGNAESDFRVAVGYIVNYVRTNGVDDIDEIKVMFGKDSVSVAEARLVLNALYVDWFVKKLAQDSQVNSWARKTDNYTWGDVVSFTENPFSSVTIGCRGAGSEFSIGMLRAYTNVMSASEARLVNFVRGHEHRSSVMDSGLVHTLPVAGEVRCYDGRRGEHGDIDFAYSLQLAAKVAENKLFYMKRERYSETVTRQESGKQFFVEKA